MPEVHLQGVPVQFPFTPYDSQREFMRKVILALQNVSVFLPPIAAQVHVLGVEPSD